MGRRKKAKLRTRFTNASFRSFSFQRRVNESMYYFAMRNRFGNQDQMYRIDQIVNQPFQDGKLDEIYELNKHNLRRVLPLIIWH